MKSLQWKYRGPPQLKILLQLDTLLFLLSVKFIISRTYMGGAFFSLNLLKELFQYSKYCTQKSLSTIKSVSAFHGYIP
jgi:hypothetical protein